MMRKALDGFYLGCKVLSCISIMFITAVVACQVLLNLIDATAAWLGLPGLALMIPSYSTFSGYGLAFATFLALGPAIRSGAHIRVTLLQERLPARAQRPVMLLIALAGVGLAGLMTKALIGLAYEAWDFGDKSSGLIAVPLWIPQAVLAFGALALLIACLDLLIEVLRHGGSPAFKDPQSEETGT